MESNNHKVASSIASINYDITFMALQLLYKDNNLEWAMRLVSQNWNTILTPMLFNKIHLKTTSLKLKISDESKFEDVHTYVNNNANKVTLKEMEVLHWRALNMYNQTSCLYLENDAEQYLYNIDLNRFRKLTRVWCVPSVLQVCTIANFIQYSCQGTVPRLACSYAQKHLHETRY